MTAKLYDRGLFWLALIVGGLVGAIVASMVLEADDPIADPPRAPSEFCNTAEGLLDVGEAQIDLSADDGGTLVQVRDVLLALEPLAAGPVTADLDRLVTGLDEVMAIAEGAPDDDPGGIALLTAALDEWSAQTADESERVRDYVQRWCGFDPTGATPTTPVTGG